MPWDACLNKDVHESVRRHCVLSRATLRRQGKRDDPRMFSMATPAEGSSAYRRILDADNRYGAPSPKRIAQDIDGVFKAIKIVIEWKGRYVPGLAERSGRRYLKAKETSNNWGGPREKGDHSIAYLKKLTLMHPDLQAMRKEEREMRAQQRRQRGAGRSVAAAAATAEVEAAEEEEGEFV